MTTRTSTEQARLAEIETRHVIEKMQKFQSAKREISRDKTITLQSYECKSEQLEDRTVRFTITMSTPDREKDVVETGGIVTDAFMLNPVCMWAHDYRQLPVGRCLRIDRYPDRLQAVVQFATADMNPLGEQVYRMVKAGFLNATSIGFRPIRWSYNEARGGVDFHEVELVEFSIVPIPAHPSALIASSVDTTTMREWAANMLRTIDGTDTRTRDANASPDLDEVILRFADDPSDVIELSDDDLHALPHIVSASLRDALAPIIGLETRRAIAKARGQIFDEDDIVVAWRES
jgi:HK97 family phage prohead protease